MDVEVNEGRPKVGSKIMKMKKKELIEKTEVYRDGSESNVVE